MEEKSVDIIIVGAGAAGLMAAREISKTGKKVLVLEARDRVGGRIYPLPQNEWEYEAAGGAELVHGEAPTTRALAKEAGLTVTPLGEWWSVDSGTPKQLTGPVAENPLLVQKLNELATDIPIAEFFDTYFADKQYDALRKNIFMRIEGYYAGDPAKTSSFALRDELNDESSSENFRIKEGYGAMIRYLQTQSEKQGVEIALNKKVEEVEWSSENVHVRCADGSTYQAAKVIVTVPLPMLQEITFTPAIPEKLEAVSKIGFGSALKIALRFKTHWWHHARGEDLNKLSFMRSTEPVAIWWTQYPEPHTTLIGWMGGRKAEEFAQKSEKQVVELALTSLANIFDTPLETLKNELVTSKVINWTNDPYTKGAYSYSTPETIGALKELLQPIEDRVYFAGEAICDDTSVGATVEAALESGLQIAKSVV